MQQRIKKKKIYTLVLTALNTFLGKEAMCKQAARFNFFNLKLSDIQH